MTVESRPQHADLSLASRDAAMPGLPYLLDNHRLSDLLGEHVHVTRVRYKPRTSLLVAFRRTRNGSFDYGWAMTRASAGKLLRREEAVRLRGGDARILRPDLDSEETLVAVGGVEDDWGLHENLTWLREHGLARLGLHRPAGTSLLSGSTAVLRYKPGRCLVLLLQNGGAPLVVKTVAKPNHAGRREFHELLQVNGVPVLPQLGDAEFARHGITASAAWGGGDLSGLEEAGGAQRAGQALARVHGIPASSGSGTASSGSGAVGTPLFNPVDRLAKTRSMVSWLHPELEKTARRLERALAGRLAERGSQEVLLHGNFSPEQVLVNASEVRILDFDQIRSGDREADLGSFAAAEEAGSRGPGASGASGDGWAGGSVTASLAEGYASAGGRFTRAGVNVWAAVRLFTDCMEPFNGRSPDWAASMDWHLRRAGELVGL
ncbi:MAG: aminoglycoside phosphotransferase family protein [Actinomycetota bacterium]|nr:aminoglycoside phosphotransferase family protein [Actinomycetota bacterium]